MSSMLDDLFETLATVPEQHAPSAPFCRLMKRIARAEVERMFSDPDPDPTPFGPFGSIVFPFRQMGTISSLNLFDVDELILFCFYWRNRARYRRVADIGANIGLHSLVLSRCGYAVQSFEPDPQHVAWLNETMSGNDCVAVSVVPAAVSDNNDMQEFVRVLDNTTGSHLAGAKANPYGRLERFTVPVMSIRDIIHRVDFLKIDAEGQERQILLATDPDDWQAADAIVEIGNVENALAVYDHFSGSPVRLYAQKTGWTQVRTREEMPTSYRDGSLFITSKGAMPWHDDGAAGDVRFTGNDGSSRIPGTNTAAA